jgi:hypothetical protein
MANPNPRLVPYFSLDGRRQVSALVDPNTKFELIQFIFDLNGTPYDDWYQLQKGSDVDQIIQKTKKDLGGVVYDLPVAMGNQGSRFNPFVVPYFSPSGKMQLAALYDQITKVQLIRFIYELDGKSYDDWFGLRSDSDMDQVTKKAVNDLNGVVYNMQLRR